MELEENPLLQQEDYRAGYNESIENLKNNPKTIQFDKLCYELFHGTEMGKKFMEHVLEHYLIPPLAGRDNPDFAIKAIWAEGFKDFGRMLRLSVASHDQRIKAGAK